MRLKAYHMLLKTSLFLIAGSVTLAQANDGSDHGNKFFGDGAMPDFIREFAAADGEPGLSEEERQAMKAALEMKREEFLAGIDTDGDGSISLTEGVEMLAEIRARILERRRERFDDANTNNTGASEDCLDKDEFLALPGIGMIPADKADMLFAHLAGDDDCISLEEFLRVLPPVGPPSSPPAGPPSGLPSGPPSTP